MFDDITETLLVVGFLGSPDPLTPKQRSNIAKTLNHFRKTKLRKYVLVALHGDREGSDADFDQVCKSLEMNRVCIPSQESRAFTDAILISPSMSNHAADLSIIQRSAIVLVCITEENLVDDGYIPGLIMELKAVDKPFMVFTPQGRIL